MNFAVYQYSYIRKWENELVLVIFKCDLVVITDIIIKVICILINELEKIGQLYIVLKLIHIVLVIIFSNSLIQLYLFFADTVRPTAYINTESTFTNASRISVNISFSEPCARGGGFTCSVNSCNVSSWSAKT